MKNKYYTALPGCLLAALSTMVCTTPAFASAATDCHQEATDYGISAELVDEYVYGCMASRGELGAEEAVDVEYAPPDELEYDQDLQEDLQTDDGDAAQ